MEAAPKWFTNASTRLHRMGYSLVAQLNSPAHNQAVNADHSSAVNVSPSQSGLGFPHGMDPAASVGDLDIILAVPL